MELGEAIEEFLLRGGAINLSEQSITWYRQMLFRFAAAVGEGTDVQAIDAAKLRAFLAGRRRNGCRATSVNAYRRALGALFRWLGREGLTGPDPLARVERLKEPSG